MSMKSSMSLLLGGALLLTMASCGKENHKSGKRSEANPICEDVSCLSTVNWRIQLPGKVFPDKVRVDINGATVLNECVSKQKYMIERDASPQTLYLENYVIPKRGDLKIHIHDLGRCDDYSMFLENNNVSFDLVKTGLDRELVINL